MRVGTFIVTLGLNFAVAAAAVAEPPSIGGVTLGDNQTAVVALLGQPLQSISTGDSLDPQMEYDGITIWLWEGKGVAQIRSTSPKYCFSAQVCPGSSISHLQAALGAPDGRSEAGEGRNEFGVDAEACWLEATVSNSVVIALELKCQP